MSGKQHSTIGVIVAVILCAVLTVIGSNKLSVDDSFLLVIGSFIGSLIVDVDSVKSKFAQKFTKVVTIAVWSFLAITLVDKYLLAGVSSQSFSIISKGLNMIDNRFWLLCLCIVTTLGKMSPHRQFTHKWFGASLFCVFAYLSFDKIFAFGFILGLVLHLLADKTTKAGLHILNFKLPLQNSNGNFDAHF